MPLKNLCKRARIKFNMPRFFTYFFCSSVHSRVNGNIKFSATVNWSGNIKLKVKYMEIQFR